MLLRFRVENHRSLRDAAELSLVSSQARGAVPSDGDWRRATTRVAGIYGANASGKSTVLHAMDFMIAAVSFSATRWGDHDSFRYHPFSLDSRGGTKPSSYELDFVAEGVRYTYGFESNASGIRSEWLYSYPERRRRVLFERSQGERPEIEFGRHLPGENVTISKLVKPTSLFLSVAANNNHPTLTSLQQHLARHVGYARFTEADKQGRIRMVARLIEDRVLLRQTEALLRFADLGISGVELKANDASGPHRELVKKIADALKQSDAVPEDSVDVLFGDLQKKISFTHVSESSGESFSLPLTAQSSGTIAWLSICVPALMALRNGDVFVIDELDSSLHPRLSAALISMFKDPVINPTGAQLIFTSHDTSLLGRMLGENTLGADEVWFTEKDASGGTELYALREFTVRASDNVERRYLQGRYGAVPMIELDDLRAALAGGE
ncbi:AAA family ATPase [Saccharopolyspora flava]|uniref:AAA family ATPase n=1 Tax=Saccharopolyspora flava TaxID=95161 RepID=UPI000B814041|nr:ATP-binding protein [Saccharopolyspora flava]